jgi:hypothetical protein
MLPMVKGKNEGLLNDYCEIAGYCLRSVILLPIAEGARTSSNVMEKVPRFTRDCLGETNVFLDLGVSYLEIFYSIQYGHAP